MKKIIGRIANIITAVTDTVLIITVFALVVTACTTFQHRLGLRHSIGPYGQEATRFCLGHPMFFLTAIGIETFALFLICLRTKIVDANSPKWAWFSKIDGSYVVNCETGISEHRGTFRIRRRSIVIPRGDRCFRTKEDGRIVTYRIGGPLRLMMTNDRLNELNKIGLEYRWQIRLQMSGLVLSHLVKEAIEAKIQERIDGGKESAMKFYLRNLHVPGLGPVPFNDENGSDEIPIEIVSVVPKAV